MAEQRRPGRGKAIPHHPLVEALAADPNKPPTRATKLFGFPGPAAEAKATRLWLDSELTSYVEVPDEAILHSQTLESDQGTILWVQPDARLTHSTTASQEVQADFLGGSIAAGNLEAAARVNLGPMMLLEAPGAKTYDSECFKPGSYSQEECHTWDGCRSQEWPCPPVESRDIACPVWTVDPPCEPAGSGGGQGQVGPNRGGGQVGVLARPWRPGIIGGRVSSYLVVCQTPATGCPDPIPRWLRISVGIPCP